MFGVERDVGELIPMVTGIEIYYQAGSLIKARIDLLVDMTDTSNDGVATTD